MNGELIYSVGADGNGQRLDLWLAEQQALTRSAAQRWIAQGYVTLNGKPASKNVRLAPEDQVGVCPPDPEPSEVIPQNIPLQVLYEDGDLLVVDKPKGMVVHPAAGNASGTLVNALLWHCGDSLSGIGGVLRPGIVHRLDKDTGGLLVVAKNDRVHAALTDQLKARKPERLYEAVVQGIPDTAGCVHAPIARHPTDRKRMAVVAGGREAVTHYRLTETFHGFARVELSLETGRTHQIRVHMAYLHHPVLGDPLYGGDKTPFAMKHASLLRGQCLYARTLAFVHPGTGKPMRFEQPLPDWFEMILQKLRSESGKGGFC